MMLTRVLSVSTTSSLSSAQDDVHPGEPPCRRLGRSGFQEAGDYDRGAVYKHSTVRRSKIPLNNQESARGSPLLSADVLHK